MRNSMIIAMAVALLAVSASALYIPMDSQINIGRMTAQEPGGNAIYNPFTADPVTFGPDANTRLNLNPGGSWWYTYVDFFLAGETADWIDITGQTMTFETRFFQGGDNTDPYGDAPVFVRLYTYSDDGTGTFPTYVGFRDFGIVQATQAPWNDPPYPTWTTVTIDLNDTAAYTEGGEFDPTKVSRMRFFGTDWAGKGQDFVDFKNLSIVPEPTTLSLLGLAGLALLRRRKK